MSPHRPMTVFPGAEVNGRLIDPAVLKKFRSAGKEFQSTDKQLPPCPPEDTYAIPMPPAFKHSDRSHIPRTAVLPERLVRKRDPWADYEVMAQRHHIQIVILKNVDKVFDVEQLPNTNAEKYKSSECLFVVGLESVYSFKDSLFFVYEHQQISVLDLSETSPDLLTDEVIALICDNTLRGLKWIHDNLGTGSGRVTRESLWISEAGIVKIGDFGRSQLCKSDVEDDRRALSDVTFELLSPGFKTEEANQCVGNWSNPAHTFWLRIQTSTIMDLLVDYFLQQKADRKELVTAREDVRRLIIS